MTPNGPPYIKVLSQREFNHYHQLIGTTDENIERHCATMAFVCIHCTPPIAEKFGHTQPHFTRNHPNVLNLFFDDVEADRTGDLFADGVICTATAFTADQADALLAFIEANRDKASWMLHCTAGISRSGAVGQFICDYFGANQSVFARMNPRIRPNAQVLAQLRRAQHRRDQDEYAQDEPPTPCS